MEHARTVLPAKFREWQKLAARLGFTDFVAAEDGFSSLLGSGEKWGNREACGIYFWIADDEQTYVGQTVKARARLQEHWRNHPDLAYVCFQVVPREQLNKVEEHLIDQVCAAGHPTRNIKHALQTVRHVPFDIFLEEEDRDHFLTGGSLHDEPWRELPLLEQKQSHKYARWRRLGSSEVVLNALGMFIDRVVPRPAVTEARFWSLSIFPVSGFVRVNAGQQEVFTVERGDDSEWYARPLSLAPIGPLPQVPMYQTDSYDSWVPVQGLSRWLTGSNLLSCRELVVRLMRHTTTLNSGSHCPQAVREALP